MKSLYIDTNILIYQSLPKSSLYLDSFNFIKFCQKQNIELVTSTETFQEILYFTQRTNQLKTGLKICKKSIEITRVLEISMGTIFLYISLLEKNPHLISRDVLHLASCQENRIDGFVTFDKELSRTKIVPVYSPQSIIYS